MNTGTLVGSLIVAAVLAVVIGLVVQAMCAAGGTGPSGRRS